ncbi:MAG: PAS domain S-box protein [bacterium]|nr:PAS domain S-box protein [bacterium]
MAKPTYEELEEKLEALEDQALEREADDAAVRRSEELFRALAESSPAVITIHGLDEGQLGKYLYVNPAFEEAFGYTREEALQMTPLKLIHPDVRDDVSESAVARLKGEKVQSRYEFKATTKGGDVKWFDLSATVINYDGRPATVAATQEITDRKRAEVELRKAHDELEVRVRERTRDLSKRNQELRESEARFRAVAEAAPCGIFIYQGTKVVYANDSLVELSGYSRDELAGRHFWEAIHPDFRDLVRERAAARLRGESVPARYELKVIRKDGQERWGDYSACRLELAGGPAVLGVVVDITEQKHAEEQIKVMAYHDTLTGLPNRRLFADRLSLAVAQTQRAGDRIGILFLDLDHLKKINDTLGHTLGDLLLQAVAERLRQSVREGDTVARLAGDEFTILVPGIAGVDDAALIAEKILDSVRQSFWFGDREIRTSCSIGVSVFPDDGTDVETLLESADSAMYRAKKAGRDTYKLAHSSDQEQA